MSEEKHTSIRKWNDSDDAPEMTGEQFDRAEIRIGDKIIRPATGTWTKDYCQPRDAD